MLSKYEELKIASNVLGKSMTKLLKADSHDIREACINSHIDPDLTNRINKVIADASKKWNGFNYSDKKVKSQTA